MLSWLFSLGGFSSPSPQKIEPTCIINNQQYNYDPIPQTPNDSKSSSQGLDQNVQKISTNPPTPSEKVSHVLHVQPSLIEAYYHQTTSTTTKTVEEQYSDSNSINTNNPPLHGLKSSLSRVWSAPSGSTSTELVDCDRTTAPNFNNSNNNNNTMNNNSNNNMNINNNHNTNNNSQINIDPTDNMITGLYYPNDSTKFTNNDNSSSPSWQLASITTTTTSSSIAQHTISPILSALKMAKIASLSIPAHITDSQVSSYVDIGTDPSSNTPTNHHETIKSSIMTTISSSSSSSSSSFSSSSSPLTRPLTVTSPLLEQQRPSSTTSPLLFTPSPSSPATLVLNVYGNPPVVATPPSSQSSSTLKLPQLSPFNPSKNDGGESSLSPPPSDKSIVSPMVRFYHHFRTILHGCVGIKLLLSPPVTNNQYIPKFIDITSKMMSTMVLSVKSTVTKKSKCVPQSVELVTCAILLGVGVIIDEVNTSFLFTALSDALLCCCLII